MKLSYQEKPIRAKKDTKPIVLGARVWKNADFTINGEEITGLVSTHWLYFEYGEQWYKLDIQTYGVSLKDLELQTRQMPVQTIEDKRLRRQERRRARRARLAELEEKARSQEDYTEG